MYTTKPIDTFDIALTSDSLEFAELLAKKHPRI